jgi:hypothetical protein
MFYKKSLFLMLSAIFICASAQAETPDADQMWKMIQQQQSVIDELKKKLEMTEQKVEVTEKKVDETALEVEAATDAMVAQSSSSGGGWFDKTNIGGYGELHYNSKEDGNDQVDFHRFVLYFGHEFTDNIRFFSELELEHSLAGESKPGEVELEQAWIELDINDNHRVRAGLDIIPVGIINYTHEPNTFYGVERPEVEKRIIPATWWEAGIGLNGELAPGLNYDVVLHSGLETTTSIRSGRQKVANANADHGAITTRLRYTGTPGLEVGGTFQYQSDITAGATDESNSATLFEGHIIYDHSSGLGVKALYARWDLDDELQAGRDDSEQWGYYVEPQYRFPLSFMPGDLGVFVRWSELDYSNTNEEERIGFGFNYWPTDQVAFKFDFTNTEDSDADTSSKTLNLGVGYSF